MRILFTNNTLSLRAGTELYVRDVCLELIKRGHRPAAFSCLIGPVGEEMRALGVEIVDDLSSLTEAPDVIHAHHRLETIMAAQAFPQVPMLHMCHGALPWVEKVPTVANIAVHGAVDLACKERVVKEAGVAPEDVLLFPNFVDLERFRPRKELPSHPKRALVFSNYASEDGQLPAIREACRQTGLKLDLLSGSADPEHTLLDYDIVFAKGRAALEALAVGCSVVLCDRMGSGPLVRRSEIEELRDWNFGFRKLTGALLPKILAEQIGRYDANDAAACTQFVRENSGLGTAVDKLIDAYLIAARTPIPSEAEVGASILKEMQILRTDMGDQTWKFDPALPSQIDFTDGRWGRKLRRIKARFTDLLREFRPPKSS